ncbi:MAG: 5-formyltetrahydrofolate cyclo-ligase [Amylibacter sp.]
MSIAQNKADARKVAFAARKVAFETGLDEAANRNLIGQLALYRDAEIIAAYMPIRTEVSPRATMTILHGQEKRICVPVIQGAGLPLKFQEWTPDAEMLNGPFGASVPASGEFLQPDVLITPLLSFDRKGYRLGYGGGFYDRSFAELSALKPVIGVGFAYSAQQVKRVPTEPTDYKLNAIVTEIDVIRF